MSQELFSIESFQKFNKAPFRKNCNKNLVIEKLTQNGFNKIIKTLSSEIKHRTYTVSDYKEYFRIKDKDTNIVRRVINFEFKDFFCICIWFFSFKKKLQRIESEIPLEASGFLTQ
jgi:hypothetical protein